MIRNYVATIFHHLQRPPAFPLLRNIHSLFISFFLSFSSTCPVPHTRSHTPSSSPSHTLFLSLPPSHTHSLSLSLSLPQMCNVCTIFDTFTANNSYPDYETILYTATELCGKRMHLFSRSFFLGKQKKDNFNDMKTFSDFFYLKMRRLQNRFEFIFSEIFCNQLLIL